MTVTRVETLICNGNWSTLALFAVHHPLAVLAFPMQIQSTLDGKNIKSALHGGKTTAIRNSRGHYDYTEPWPPVQQDCAIPARYLNQTMIASVQDLERKYQSQGFNVAVYLAPIPACTNAAVFAKRTYRDLSQSVPAVLPPSLFAEDGFYGHPRPNAVPEASHLLAHALRTRADMAGPLGRDVSDPFCISKLK